jgi:hypothetical protein
MRRFVPGESIVWRSVDATERIVSTVWPWTVVRDDTEGIVLYMPTGTVGKQRTGERGGPRGRMLVRWDGGHHDITWHSTTVVRLYREGDPFSIWLARDATTNALAWRYINLEEPWRRTPIGFDSRDLWLDLYSEPGEDEWHWKDEDEADWLIEQGRIDRAFIERVRAYGDDAVTRIRAGKTLLHDRWSAFIPEPAWATPVAPEDWRELEPRRR